MRRKKGKGDKAKLTDSQVIVETILTRSAFKVPNLSEQVKEQFLVDPEYSRAMANIEYETTVDSYFGEVTVQPHTPGDILRIVEPHPSAITTLGCIHEKPPLKRDRWGKRGKRKAKDKSPSKEDNNADSNADKNNDKNRKLAIRAARTDEPPESATEPTTELSSKQTPMDVH